MISKITFPDLPKARGRIKLARIKPHITKVLDLIIIPISQIKMLRILLKIPKNNLTKVVNLLLMEINPILKAVVSHHLMGINLVIPLNMTFLMGEWVRVLSSLCQIKKVQRRRSVLNKNNKVLDLRKVLDLTTTKVAQPAEVLLATDPRQFRVSP